MILVHLYKGKCKLKFGLVVLYFFFCTVVCCILCPSLSPYLDFCFTTRLLHWCVTIVLVVAINSLYFTWIKDLRTSSPTNWIKIQSVLCIQWGELLEVQREIHMQSSAYMHFQPLRKEWWKDLMHWHNTRDADLRKGCEKVCIQGQWRMLKYEVLWCYKDPQGGDMQIFFKSVSSSLHSKAEFFYVSIYALV